MAFFRSAVGPSRGVIRGARGAVAARAADVNCHCPSEWNLIGNVAAIYFLDRVDAVPVVHTTQLTPAARPLSTAVWARASCSKTSSADIGSP